MKSEGQADSGKGSQLSTGINFTRHTKALVLLESYVMGQDSMSYRSVSTDKRGMKHFKKITYPTILVTFGLRYSQQVEVINTVC